MQASERVLAWRYARALFLAAKESKEEPRVQEDLQGSRRAILDSLPLLRHPRVSTAEKKKKLQALLGGKISELTLRFLELLVEKKRFELLPLVSANLSALIAEEKNIAKAQVRTARPLPNSALEKLKERLERFTGKQIELELKEDPEIIGGLVVRVGDWVLDSSLRGQLRHMREEFNGN